MIDDFFADRVSSSVCAFTSYHPMLNERSFMDQEISLQNCRFRYAHYGGFASFPLRTAVLETQTYSHEGFISAARSRNSAVSEFMNGLTYEGKDYFTIEESRFLVQLFAWYDPIKDKKLEADLRELSGVTRHGSAVILQSHAKALVKAVNFWKMNFNDKRQEWTRKFIDAEEADLARRRAEIGSVVRDTRNIRDEGYESDEDDRDSDDDHYYCQFDVEDEDDEDEDDENEGEEI